MNNIKRDFKRKANLVRGKGGPVDDANLVPMSRGEYVLPADTVQAVGEEKLDELVDSTHVPAEIQRDGMTLRGLANGGYYSLTPDRKFPDKYHPPGILDVTADGATDMIRAAGRGLRGLGQSIMQTAYMGRADGGVTPEEDLRYGRIKRPVDVTATTPQRVLSPADELLRFGGGNAQPPRTSGVTGEFPDAPPTNVPQSNFMSKAYEAAKTAVPYLLKNVQIPSSGPLSAVANTGKNLYNARAQAEANTPVHATALSAEKPAAPTPTSNGPATEEERLALLRSSPAEYQNLGNYGGAPGANIYGRYNPEVGGAKRLNDFVGVGAPMSDAQRLAQAPDVFGQLARVQSLREPGRPREYSNAPEINARFDEQARRLSSMYGPKARGNLTKHLVDLEKLRTAALAQDQQMNMTLQGQDRSAEAAKRQALTLRGFGTAPHAASVKATSPTATQTGTGFKNFDKATESMFNVKNPETGKFEPDKGAQEAFRNFYSSLPSEVLGDIDQMSEPQQRRVLAKAKKYFDIQQRSGETAQRVGGPVSGTARPITNLHEARFRDVWDPTMNLPMWDYTKAKTGFANPLVANVGNQASLLEDLAAAPGGGIDADALDFISFVTGKDKDGKPLTEEARKKLTARIGG